MGWIYAASRRSGRLAPVDADDEEYPINAFACEAEIRAFAIRCPACGTPYEVRMRDVRATVFNRRLQRFR